MYKTILTRRSTRSFSNKPVPKKLIKKIVKAGIHAPSSKNSQPWFFVIDSTNKKNKIAEILEKKANKNYTIIDPRTEKPAAITSAKVSAKIIKQAPVVIFIFSESPFTGGKKELLKKPELKYLLSYSSEIQSIAAAIQNMSLTAHAFGLGSLWTCDVYYIEKYIKKIYNQKNDFIAALCLGYPKQKPKYQIPRIKKYKFIS